MPRLSSFAIATTVLVAFVVTASHLGMMDHSSMDAMTITATPVAMASSEMQTATALPAVDQPMSARQPMPAHPLGSGMAMTTICELMVLVTAFGVVLWRVVASWRARWTAKVYAHLPAPIPSPVPRLGRPPGLSMLCVVRC